jgi:hypothetical protein
LRGNPVASGARPKIGFAAGGVWVQMFELYFLFYYIPKMMSRLARERNRSPVAWSLIGIAAWLCGELIVPLSFGMAYGVGVILRGWPKQIPAGFRVLVYAAVLATAIVGVTFARRILSSKSNDTSFLLPPPPTRF